MIIIVGDSWGVGEYSKQHQLSGPGFANYLALNNTVVNLSVGDSSNTQSIQQLEFFLSRLNSNFDLQFDTFYWFVTDPIRCVETTILQNPRSIKQTTDSALHDVLERANILASRFNLKLKLIGGLCDLTDVNISEFRNLEISVTSWGQLLLETYSTSRYGDASRWTSLGGAIESHHPELISDWVDIATELENKFRSWDELKDTFFTTCGAHPDRTGHLVLRDHLYPAAQNLR